mmetsp:Transcript_30648/g.79601  ORF Transcript_30648/g.79601 Transcript_30648/m.79601 type:complete len:398 (+) Transcript_30648:660-1853(+)
MHQCNLGLETHQCHLELVESLVDLLLRDDKWRHQPHNPQASRHGEHARLHELRDHIRRHETTFLGQLNANDQTPAAHLLDGACVRCHSLEAAAQLLATCAHIVEQAILLEGAHDRIASGAREWIAAICRSMFTRHEDVGTLLAAHGSNRHAAAERLGSREDINLDAVLHVAPHLARAAHARLHFVCHEQRARLITQGARCLIELRRRWRNATLALEGLKHDCSDLAPTVEKPTVHLLDHGTEGIDVIIWHVLEALDHLAAIPKALLVFGLAGRRDGGERATMERVQRRDDDRLGCSKHGAPVLTSELDRSLVGFRARVAEEGAIRTRGIHQTLGKLTLIWDVVQVGDVVHLTHLLINSSDQPLVGMAEAARRDASSAVQILIPIRVPQIGTLAMGDD